MALTTALSDDTKKSEKTVVGVKKREKSETAKRLKREKKKRRAIRKAKKKQEGASGSSSATDEEEHNKKREKLVAAGQSIINIKWCRVGKSDGCPKAHNRPVDEEKINTLLEQRSQAKTDKEYTTSDDIAETMRKLGVYYFDARKEWHTRLLSTVAKEKRMEAHAKYNDDE